MNRYSRLDNQSPVVEAMESNDINVGRSAHDCSHIVNGNAMPGMLAPVLTMECVLNEDIDINLASLIEFRNPTTRRLFNSFRVYFHGYFNAITDLWEGAKNWLDKGRSGKLDLSRPNLIYKKSITYTDSGTTITLTANACTPMSLLNFLGLPAESYQGLISRGTYRSPIRQFQTSVSCSDDTVVSATKVGESVDYFPADVCMAYQRNWRDFYSNKNLLMNNKMWFPDNEDHFILSYSCENAVAIKYEDEDFASTTSLKNQTQFENLTAVSPSLAFTLDDSSTPEPNNPSSISHNDVWYAPNLCGIKFRQFRGDRFTTASPFPDLLRGDIPLLQLTEDNFVNYADVVDGSVTRKSKVNGIPGNSRSALYENIDGQAHTLSLQTVSGDDVFNHALVTPESTVTMSDIYTLETLTTFKRKMGMTNGDYSEMMQAQFGVKPKVHSHRGTYIGGFYQDFALSSVVQQSESGDTPLGTKAGQGVSSGSGRIGHFHTTDFGWISVYMSIMPDVYYTQGKPRQYSKKSNLEMYFPIFNNLPAQGIRNDELYIFRNSSYKQII